MEKVRVTIEIPVRQEEFKEAARDQPVEAAKCLEQELRKFDNYLMRRGMEGMGRYERQMVREYIGFKLVSEETGE